MSLFRNKYRIESARWQNWNYANAGAYFITICTKDRSCHFRDIENDEMQLSNAGKLAEKYWIEIPEHLKNVQLGEFLVMPNHIHGILILTDATVAVEMLHCNVSTGEPNPFMSDISPKPGSVPTIIRSYKLICTKNINLQIPELDFVWQPRFHDRVIRDEMEYQRIVNYIINNPKNWGNDKFYS